MAHRIPGRANYDAVRVFHHYRKTSVGIGYQNLGTAIGVGRGDCCLIKNEQPDNVSLSLTFGNGAEPVIQENEFGFLCRTAWCNDDTRQAAFKHTERDRGPIHSSVVDDVE